MRKKCGEREEKEEEQEEEEEEEEEEEKEEEEEQKVFLLHFPSKNNVEEGVKFSAS